MRRPFLKTGAIVTVITFALSGIAPAETLAPGKPAGVHSAQMGDKEWLVFGGVAVLLAAVLIANSGSNNGATPAPPFTATST